MASLIQARRIINNTQSIQPRTQLVTQRLIAYVKRLSALSQSGRAVPEVNDPIVREVIQGSYRIVYRLIRKEIHIITVHHAARLLSLEP